MSGPSNNLVESGIPGLDAVLRGGLPRNTVHLVQGGTGTGKTTLGLQFSLAAPPGESALYVTFAETTDEIARIAASHGWSLDGLDIFRLDPVDPDGDDVQTVLHPAEVELPAKIEAVLERVERSRPARLVIDSLAELRIVSREPRLYRRELMRLRARLGALDCTVLLLDTGDAWEAGESLLGSVIRLERLTPSYGPDRRVLHVVKMRGHEYSTGKQDVRIKRGGLEVYPRLVAARHRTGFEARQLSTGLPAFDRMLGGGLDRGTASLLLGPTGTGKSTLALKCVAAAAERGERVLAYIFDERLQTVYQRAEGIGIDLRRHVDSGLVTLRQVDPAELTPGEFAHEVSAAEQEGGVQMVLIDSLNAYLYAMPDERLLNVHLHELLAYLSQRGVTSLMVATQHGVATGLSLPPELDVSYLADTVVLLRQLEVGDTIRKSVTVFKRRAGPHEHTVRELVLKQGGIDIGEGFHVASGERLIGSLAASEQREGSAADG